MHEIKLPSFITQLLLGAGVQTDKKVIPAKSDDAFQNLHVGLELLSFSSSVFSILEQIGLPTYQSRIRELTDAKILSDKTLTEEEKNIVKTLEAIDQYLPNNRPSSTQVYERKSPDQKIALGFSDGLHIYLLREILSDFAKAADVYVHEKAHHNTGGSLDASADFRNYLTFALSRLALEELKKIRPDLIQNSQAV